MDTRYAIVENGTVTNVAMWDGQGTWPLAGTPVSVPDVSPVSIGYTYDGTNFTAPPVPQPSLADAQAAQAALVSAACQNAIFAGFSSNALGTAHTYPAKATDQQNLASSVLASLMPNLPSTWTTPFWCADSSGNWSWATHTAAQIQQVGQDGKAAILTCMSKNQQLQDQIAAATTVSAVQQITW